MNRSIYWAWAIKNSICLICWTVLAIAFDKWGIALFSLLFMSSIGTNKYYRVCDKCGRHSEYANSPEEALEKAKKSGWIHYVGMNKDYCPNCQYIKR